MGLLLELKHNDPDKNTVIVTIPPSTEAQQLTIVLRKSSPSRTTIDLIAPQDIKIIRQKLQEHKGND